MANRLSQVAIWKAVAKKLHDEYKCTVYSDEVLEEFTMPCFCKAFNEFRDANKELY